MIKHNKKVLFSIGVVIVLLLSVMTVTTVGSSESVYDESFQQDDDTFELTVDSIEGGEVVEPGEGDFEYDEGEVVDLEAVVDEGYHFIEWTGDNGTIENTENNETTITMDGDYTITAEFEGIVDTVEIDPYEKQKVLSGYTVEFIAEAYDDNDELIARGWRDFEWQNATRGVFVKESVGEYEVTASLADVTSDPTTVEVVSSPDYIEIEPVEETIVAGQTVQYTAIAYDEEGKEIADVSEDEETEWTDNVDPEVASSWSDNEITVEEVGDWTITGEYDGLTDTADLTVEPAEAEDFWILPEEAEVVEEEPQEYTAYAEDEYGNEFEVTDETDWSDDAGEASWWSENKIKIEESGEWTIIGEYEGMKDTATLVVEPIEPEYMVDITEYDEEVEEGYDVTVEYEIVNTGNDGGRQNIVLFINGDQEDVHRDLELEPGHSYRDKFVWTSEDPGDYELEVSSDDDVDTAIVRILQRANFEITITDYDEDVVRRDEITIEYTVENTGEVEDTQNIVFYVDEEQEDAHLDITLDGGEEHSGEFTWRVEEVKEYIFEVASRDDIKEVTINVESRDVPGFTLGLLVLAIGLTVAIYQKKRTK